MRSQVFLPDSRSLSVDSVSVDGESGKVEVVVHSTNDCAKCPRCGKKSSRVHSHYLRQLTDLPWQGVSVHLTWRSRKFFCRDEQCTQKIFTERLPEVARPHARRSERLSLAVRCIGIACGGEGGSRLAKRLGMKFSPDTLLRETRCTLISKRRTPRVLGVDDWAFRKGQRYGTVLVDRENNCVVDLLPDRDPNSLVVWLQNHPGVEIISRDRGDCYIKGATEGAPQATQVADRFHLMQNLREALARVIARHSKQVREAAQQQSKCPINPVVLSDPGNQIRKIPPSETQLPSFASQRRQDRYREVMALYHQGISQREIAIRFNLSRSTVRRFVQSGSYPERAPRPSHSHADGCVEYLWERWKQGCQNVTQLTKEIRERGFTASYYSVRRRVSSWRNGIETTSKSPPARTNIESPNQLSWMVFKDDLNLTKDQRTFKDRVFGQCPEIAEAWRIATGFIHLFKRKAGHDLPAWIDAASHDTTPRELRSFAKGILRDSSAIAAAIALPWSNGQTEGQVNRLKTLKRQMYGRGAFDLLRIRYLTST
ncbi:ISL3 family transposase [Rubripirellula reticaptiva]|uniref:Transposase n=1 Tax=Rubripirellula reticaptiva TaxID=2528013 RepID=A0A5C6ER93_9BACT|nr:ISL3 family transposase [Rubripirellula reticaptiva]TWU51562.1 Transposase [Rubripirellula reticaptiva]